MGMHTMKKIMTFFFFVFFCGVVAGSLFLLTWDIPAPSAEVRRVIPNAQLLD